MQLAPIIQQALLPRPENLTSLTPGSLAACCSARRM